MLSSRRYWPTSPTQLSHSSTSLSKKLAGLYVFKVVPRSEYRRIFFSVYPAAQASISTWQVSWILRRMNSTSRGLQALNSKIEEHETALYVALGLVTAEVWIIIKDKEAISYLLVHWPFCSTFLEKLSSVTQSIDTLPKAVPSSCLLVPIHFRAAVGHPPRDQLQGDLWGNIKQTNNERSLTRDCGPLWMHPPATYHLMQSTKTSPTICLIWAPPDLPVSPVFFFFKLACN